MNNPPDFICQFRRTVWRRDYPFQIACVQPPPPLRKNRRRGVCGAGGDCTQASQSVSSSSVKTANNKILVSGVFDDSEGLYGTTFCRCLVRKPHYSARLLRFGSRGLSELPPKCLDDRDCVVRRCTGTRHGNVYSSIREKKRELLFIGNVSFKQWHLVCVLFHYCFEGTTSLKSQILIFNSWLLSPARSHTFAKEKKELSERAAEMEPTSRSTPKRRLAYGAYGVTVARK